LQLEIEPDLFLERVEDDATAAASTVLEQHHPNGFNAFDDGPACLPRCPHDGARNRQRNQVVKKGSDRCAGCMDNVATVSSDQECIS
jgi:hypothetical protein